MSFVAYGAFKKERSFFMKKISGFFKAIGRYSQESRSSMV